MDMLQQQYSAMMNQELMMNEFEKMRIQEQRSQPVHQNYFQHLQERPSA